MGASPGYQLVEPDGLGQEVGRAGIHALEDRALVSRPRHEDDRQGGRPELLAKRPHDIEAGEPRHRDVEYDQVDQLLVDDRQALFTAGRLADVQTGPPQRDGHERPQIRLVVHHQHDRRSPVVRRRGHRLALGLPARTFPIASSRSRLDTGLATKAAPRARMASRSSVSAV